jgi:UDP-glucose 4-epimerase
LIYASSGGTIYGEPKEKLITEDHPLDPKSMYGHSKKVIESYMNFFVKNSEVNIQTLRISNPFGPYQNPYGAQGVVATAFRCTLNNSVFNVFGKGLTVRDYIFVDDVVDAIISSMKADKSHLVNISSGVGRSVLDIIGSIQKISGKEIKTKFIDQREGDVEVSILSNKKAASVYGWQPKTNFDEGLVKTWQWISSEILTSG